MTAESNAAQYNADDITHLEGLEAVRKRPGMYIGSTDSKGLNHLAFEIMDNSVDEALAGHCTRIEVTLHADGSVEIGDNGRGIPTDMNKKSKMSGVMMTMTLLHAGGKFGGSGYKSAGGLHGVGASVVNALSERVDVTVYRDSKKHVLQFSRGTAGTFDGDGLKAGFTKGGDIRVVGKAPANTTGTSVRFWPDRAIFLEDAKIDATIITNRARQTAFLVPGLEICIRNLTGAEPVEETFRFDGGLVDMVAYQAHDKPLCDTVHIRGTGTFQETVPVLDPDTGHMVSTDVEREVEVDVAFRWGTGYETSVETFVNVVRTPYGGTHKKGFERGLQRTLVDAVKSTRGLLKANEEAPILDDVVEGLTAVVSVNVPEPQFIGQTKDELGTAGVTKVVQDVVTQGVKAWLEGKKTKTQARTVLDKVVAAARVRVQQKTAKEVARRKTAMEGASMPAKLVDCRSIGVDRAELFIVEGDSALGTAKQARVSEYQALLPIRGKILNVQKATHKQVLDNAECASIIQVIGAGSGRTFDIDQMRYGKIILMADADVDGSHIRCLLLTLFSRYMRPVIEEGRMYAAMPPLHKITTKGRNPEVIYTFTQAEMEQTVARLEASGKQVVTPVPRYKGLGEMSADELWETTMNPAVRAVRRVTMEDVEAAEGTLELLMGGPASIEARRAWIVANSERLDDEHIDA